MENKIRISRQTGIRATIIKGSETKNDSNLILSKGAELEIVSFDQKSSKYICRSDFYGIKECFILSRSSNFELVPKNSPMFPNLCIREGSLLTLKDNRTCFVDMIHFKPTHAELICFNSSRVIRAGEVKNVISVPTTQQCLEAAANQGQVAAPQPPPKVIIHQQPRPPAMNQPPLLTAPVPNYPVAAPQQTQQAGNYQQPPPYGYPQPQLMPAGIYQPPLQQQTPPAGNYQHPNIPQQTAQLAAPVPNYPVAAPQQTQQAGNYQQPPPYGYPQPQLMPAGIYQPPLQQQTPPAGNYQPPNIPQQTATLLAAPVSNNLVAAPQHTQQAGNCQQPPQTQVAANPSRPGWSLPDPSLFDAYIRPKLQNDPFILHVYERSTEIVKLTLTNSRISETQMYDALSIAIRKGYNEIVFIMTDYVKNINVNVLYTFIQMAIINNASNCFKILMALPIVMKGTTAKLNNMALMFDFCTMFELIQYLERHPSFDRPFFDETIEKVRKDENCWFLMQSFNYHPDLESVYSDRSNINIILKSLLRYPTLISKRESFSGLWKEVIDNEQKIVEEGVKLYKNDTRPEVCFSTIMPQIIASSSIIGTDSQKMERFLSLVEQRSAAYTLASFSLHANK